MADLEQSVRENTQRIEAVRAEAQEKERRMAELEGNVEETKQNVQYLQQEKDDILSNLSK